MKDAGYHDGSCAPQKYLEGGVLLQQDRSRQCTQRGRQTQTDANERASSYPSQPSSTGSAGKKYDEPCTRGRQTDGGHQPVKGVSEVVRGPSLVMFHDMLT